MIKLKEILEKNNIKAIKYQKSKDITIIYTKDMKYVVDENVPNIKIIEFLLNRNFKGIPKILDIRKNIMLREYLEDVDVPEETKMKDLISLVATMHLKTSFYKEIDEVKYKELYENIYNNLIYLNDYYKDLIDIIETKVFMSPSEYLLALNITLIFDSINYSKEKIKDWYEIINNKDKNRMRVCVINNDLSLNHFYDEKEGYLTNWNKSRIDMPIFDLYKLYIRTGSEYDFIDLLKKYEKIYPLKNYELLLFYILISIPNKIEFNLNEFDMCNRIQKEIDKLIKSSNIIKNYRSLKNTFAQTK